MAIRDHPKLSHQPPEPRLEHRDVFDIAINNAVAPVHALTQIGRSRASR
jgi:hypothetical protein